MQTEAERTREETEEMKREDRAKIRKREAKKEAMDLDKIERDMRMHFAWLIIKESEYEKKMRDKALRLDRKRRKQTRGWVI
jgi:hypothetical protein